MQIHNEAKLSEFKNTDLAKIYNCFANELISVNPIKKFADKKSTIKRILKTIKEKTVLLK